MYFVCPSDPPVFAVPSFVFVLVLVLVLMVHDVWSKSSQIADITPQLNQSSRRVPSRLVLPRWSHDFYFTIPSLLLLFHPTHRRWRMFKNGLTRRGGSSSKTLPYTTPPSPPSLRCLMRSIPHQRLQALSNHRSSGMHLMQRLSRLSSAQMCLRPLLPAYRAALGPIWNKPSMGTSMARGKRLRPRNLRRPLLVYLKGLYPSRRSGAMSRANHNPMAPPPSRPLRHRNYRLSTRCRPGVTSVRLG